MKIPSALDGYKSVQTDCVWSTVHIIWVQCIRQVPHCKTLVKLQTKSCELDVIPTRILKEIMDFLMDPITTIVNISLSKGQFASQWKTAI